MIYFIADWSSTKVSLESNAMFNVTRMFSDKDIKTKIINTRMPSFFNFFANQYNFQNHTELIGLLDCVLEVSNGSHSPLNLLDLKLSPKFEKTYTKKNVLLTKDGVVKGEIYFNDFGYVAEVHYFSDLGKEVHFYSEKGYVYCKQTFDHMHKQVKRQMFDEFGKLVFTEVPNCIVIADAYLKHFKQKNYVNYKEVCIELLNKTLDNFNPKVDKIIIDASSTWITKIMANFSYMENMILMFPHDVKKVKLKINESQTLVERSKKIITDNTTFGKEILNKNYCQNITQKVNCIPFYPTNLMLGKSNTYAEQYVYWHINHLDQKTITILTSFLEMKLKMGDLCIVIESQVEADKDILIKIVTAFVNQNFNIEIGTPEYVLVKQYYEAKKKKELTPALREAFQTAKKNSQNFHQNIAAYLFSTGFEFRCNSDYQQLEIDLQKIRVYVDNCEQSNFFRHSLAVSAGIPLLSNQLSPYLVDKKNGFLIRDNEQMFKTVENYLVNTDMWNQNLVESIEVIEKFGEAELMIKWQAELK